MRVRNKACALNVLSMNSSYIVLFTAYWYNSILKVYLYFKFFNFKWVVYFIIYPKLIVFNFS